jgi:hypothetical protein
LSRRIVNVALAFCGHVKGGLGYVAIMAACILSALSGSAVADAAALSALLIPMMVKAGHDKAMSGGLIAASGIIGPVIPPSIGFVIFGVVSGVSITKLFLAGIFPGIWIAIALCCAWWWQVRKENIASPPRKTWAECAHAVVDGAWALGLPFIIVFGLKFGVFTPTEAAVVAAVYSLFVATCIYRELKLSQLYAVFVVATHHAKIAQLHTWRRPSPCEGGYRSGRRACGGAITERTSSPGRDSHSDGLDRPYRGSAHSGHRRFTNVHCDSRERNAQRRCIFRSAASGRGTRRKHSSDRTLATTKRGARDRR